VSTKQFESSGGVWRKKRKHGSGMGSKLLLVAVIGGTVYSLSHRTPQATGMLVTATRKALPLSVQSMGHVEPYRTVVVRPQVTGQITELLFTEGQEVKKGDVLARLDASLFSAQLAKAKANKEQDEAQAESTRQELRRMNTAARKISADRAASLKSAIRQFDAAIKSDSAAIEQAQAQLQYATITAPLSGRVGMKRIDAGNMIHPEDPQGLVEITQMEPVSVVFSVPQQSMPAAGRGATAQQPLAITAKDMASGKILGEGKLALADNQVNTATGAVRMKAQFDNKNRQLWPGAMVNVQVNLATLPDATVVPMAAVMRRGQENYVYKVNAQEKTVALHPVKILTTTNDEAAIAEGLAPGDQVLMENANSMTADGSARAMGAIAPAR
jgi:multidrug efflux system membrane fusion protein